MKHWTPSADSQPAGIDPAAAPFNLAPATAPEPAQSTALVPVRHDGWTAPKQANFLRVLAATGNVALAAREVGMTRQSAYKLRARLKGEPFDHAWEATLGCQYDRLAEAALERAINGTEVPHYHQGQLVGTHRRYDERLTLGMLAHRPGAPARRQPLPRVALEYVGDLSLMIDRVADGPETWGEEEEEILAAEEEMRHLEDDDDDWDDDAWEEEDDCDGDETAASTHTTVSPEALERAIRADRRRIGCPLPGDKDHEEEDAKYEKAYQAALEAAWNDEDNEDENGDDDGDGDGDGDGYGEDDDSEGGSGGQGGAIAANPPQSVNRHPEPEKPCGPRISGL